MKTTILLLSVDEESMLAHSLPLAVAQEGEKQVIVVDNASTDATAELARAHHAGLLRLAPRRSYAAAVNEAIARTEGEAVLLLNADCFLAPGFLAAALPRLMEDGVGAVAPKLLRVSGPGPRAQLDQVDAAGMFVDRRRKNGLVGFGEPSERYGLRGEAFGPDGAAAVYRRQLLEDCALADAEVLDEDMELWATDADLAWRAQLRGWRCVYEPDALAYHVRTYSPATRSAMSEPDRRIQFRNRYLMMLKNETSSGLRRDWPSIVAYELLALGHVLLRERHLLDGYRDAWRLRARTRRRRRFVQAGRRTSRPPFGLRPPR